MSDQIFEPINKAAAARDIYEESLHCLLHHPRRAVDGQANVCDLSVCKFYAPPPTPVSETQESIRAWAEETFGTTGTNMQVACRANQEMAELLMCLSRDDNDPKAGEEAADVEIVLMRLFDRLKMTMQGAIDAKMKINRARKWKLDGHGHGYHVKEQTPSDDSIKVGNVLTLRRSDLESAKGVDLDFIGEKIFGVTRHGDPKVAVADAVWREQLILMFDERRKQSDFQAHLEE